MVFRATDATTAWGSDEAVTQSPPLGTMLGSRGMLAPGWLADLAVLSADYFSVPEDQIPGITSDLTMVGGRVVHTSAAFEGLAAGL